jgi:hypothetical protein
MVVTSILIRMRISLLLLGLLFALGHNLMNPFFFRILRLWRLQLASGGPPLVVSFWYPASIAEAISCSSGDRSVLLQADDFGIPGNVNSQRACRNPAVAIITDPLNRFDMLHEVGEVFKISPKIEDVGRICLNDDAPVGQVRHNHSLFLVYRAIEYCAILKQVVFEQEHELSLDSPIG